MPTRLSEIDSNQPMRLSDVQSGSAFGPMGQGLQEDRNYPFQAKRFVQGQIPVTDLNTLALMEVFPNTQFRDIPQRRQAMRELSRRGVPKEFLNAYLSQYEDQSFLGQLKKDSPELVGGIVGGIAGSYAGRPGLGATLGASGGAALARLGKEAYNRSIYPQRAVSNPQLLTDTGWEAAVNALGEIGGRTVISGITRLARPVHPQNMIRGANRLSDELVEAGGNVKPEIYERLGTSPQVGLTGGPVKANLSIAQKTANKTIDTFESLLEGSFTGQQPFYQKKALTQIPAYMQWVDNVTENISSGMIKNLEPAKVGVFLDDSLKGGRSAFNQAVRKVYEPINQLAPDVKVNNEPVIKSASDIVKAIRQGRRIGSREETKDFVKSVAKLNKETTFADAIQNRSDLLEWKRVFERSGDRKAAALAGDLAEQIDTQMEAAARSLSGDAEKQWRRANWFKRAGEERFQGKIIRKLARDVSDDPETFVRAVFGSPTDETLVPLTRIKKVKKILLGKTGKTPLQIKEDRRAWDMARYSWLDSAIKKSLDPDGVIRATTFNDMVHKRMGDEALAELFSPSQVRRIKDIPALGRMIQGETGGEGRILIQLMQGGAIGGAAATGRLGWAATLLSAPGLVSRAILSNPVSSYLTRKSPIMAEKVLGDKSKALSGLTGRLISIMWKEKKALEREKQDIERLRAALNSLQSTGL